MDVLIVCAVIFLFACLAAALDKYDDDNNGIKFEHVNGKQYNYRICYLSKNNKPNKIETRSYKLEFIKYAETLKRVDNLITGNLKYESAAVFKVTNKTNKAINITFKGGTNHDSLWEDIITVEKRFSGELDIIYCKEGYYSLYPFSIKKFFYYDFIMVSNSTT